MVWYLNNAITRRLNGWWWHLPANAMWDHWHSSCAYTKETSTESRSSRTWVHGSQPVDVKSWTWETPPQHLQCSTVKNQTCHAITSADRVPAAQTHTGTHVLHSNVATCQLRYMYRGKNDWQLNNFGIFLSSLLYIIHVPFHIHHLAYCKFTLFTYPFIVITHLSNL